MKIKPAAFRSPNTNAFDERFIQSIGPECLDRFVIFGEQHMNHLYKEYLAHFHEECLHESLENEPIANAKETRADKARRGKIEEQEMPLTEVRCQLLPVVVRHRQV